MRQCPSCQSPVEDTAGFCNQCGYALTPGWHGSTPSQIAPSAEDPAGTRILPDDGMTFPVGMALCSACGYSNMAGEMFCQSCGVQLPPVASVPPPPPISLSSPLHGSQTTLANQPEEANHSGFESDEVDQAFLVFSQASMQPSLPKREKREVESKLILPGSEIEFLLPPSRTEVLIGRSDPVQDIFPDVDLAPYEGERRGVSRRHARIERDVHGIYLIDLNSTNYSFLNRIKIQAGQRYPIKDGDEIRLGLFVLEYRSK